jgi:xanthine dehydrogenase small subunit
MSAIEVTVNGVPRSLAGLAPSVNLLDALRGWGLTGAKEGCGEGECGACSVLVARPALDGSERTQWIAVNACLPSALSYAGQEIVTAEGLGSPSKLHPVQEAMAAGGGSQCGYCTPGFVCSMAAEYYRPDRGAAGHDGRPDHGPNGFDTHALSGNLCRCTGYRPILEAAHRLGEPDPVDPFVARSATPAPPAAPGATTVGEHTIIRPADLADALAVLAEHPEAEPVAGSTDVGVLTNLAMHRPRTVVLIDRLPELRTLLHG